MNRRDRRYILEALKESLDSTYERVNIGAVLVKAGRVVSKGANKKQPHPLQYKYNVKAARPTHTHGLHAEMNAILKNKSDLRGATVYVGRWDRRGLLAMCRPCKACRLALKEAGVTTMFFTTTEGIKRESIC